MIASLIFLIAVVCLIQVLWSRRKIYQLAWNLEGPVAWPLLGNVLAFEDKYVAQNLMDFGEKFRRLYRFWLGPHLMVFLTKPEFAEKVLNSQYCLNKGTVYWAFRKSMGSEGLVTYLDHEWKVHRKLLNPTLQHYALIRTFYPTFNKFLKNLMEQMNTHVGKGEIDVTSMFEMCSLSMVCETTFGTKLNIKENHHSVFFKATSVMSFMVGYLISHPWFHIDAIFGLTKHKNLLESSHKEARNYARRIVETKVKEFNDQNNMDSKSAKKNENDPDQKVIHNFIDESLRLTMDTNIISEEDLISNSLTVLMAGYETTSITVGYIVLMLAMHPDYQEKVFEEINGIFAHQGDDIDHAELNKLEYTNRFIKESMRLNPTVPVITRQSNIDLEIDDVIIPAGTELAIPVFQLQRSKTIWGPNAEIFDPDHFLPENIKNVHPYAYLPFSAGPRNCIGIKYAHAVVRLFVCWLVRHFRFTTSMRLKDMKYRLSVTMKLDNGYMVELHRRESY